MTKKDCMRKVTGLILLLLFIFSSSSLLFSAQANNISSKGESVENLEKLKLSATFMTTTEVVSTASTDYSAGPTIAVDGIGNIHVAWMDGTNYSGSGIDSDIFYKRWNVTSSTWTTTEVVSTESTELSGPSTIAVDGAGNVHVAWVDETNYDGSGTEADIFYKRWNATSSTWTTTEVVSTESTGSSNSLRPTIAADSAGNVHVAWDEYTDYGGSGMDIDIFYKRWNATSSTWTMTEVVSTEDGGGYPTITVDGVGNIHVAWMGHDIEYKLWNATSSTWTMTEVVSTESTVSHGYPTIAADGVGNIHMAWVDSTDYGGAGTDWDIFYKHKEVISNTWTMTEVVSTESTEHSTNPWITVDGAGNAHVVWDELTYYGGSGADYDIFYKYRDATSGTWTTTEVVSTESTEDSKRATIAVDNVGNSHIVWDDYTNYGGSGTDLDVFYKRLNPAPYIVIYSPDQNQNFGSTAPNFSISIGEPNLNTTWYTLDDGLTNKTFIGFTGTIDQTEWDKKSHGAVTIRFYANDSLGFDGYAEVSIFKDLEVPIITINSPILNQLCGIAAPNFNISIIEENLQQKLYSLNGRPNITFTWETHFSQTEWNQIGNGTVLITFYAIDKGGNINSSEVIVRKDAYVPVITILSPLDDDQFGKIAPNFNIAIIEEDLDSTWYVVEGVAGTFPLSDLTGTIDQDTWDDLPEGEITITFYAQDRAENVNSEIVVVLKSILFESAIPFELIILISVISGGIVLGVAALLLIRRKRKRIE